MSQTTPFIRRMRTQGGTFYAFSSPLEDIGLNINERNNIVKMSHFALLNIPSIDTPANLQQNKFNVFAIPGAFQSWQAGGSIKDGRIIVAESFQNYALNLECNILDVSSYNPSITTTISERVFWKWLKETGSIRWRPIDTSAGTYWKEETDTDSSIGYNSVVKCIGTISAGSVRTDTFGTYNETYILVPTSFGQTPVYFKQVEDDNYYHGLSIVNGETNILGRETYLYPHPDGLDFKAYYDLADSSLVVGGYTMQYDYSTGSYSNGWWWTPQLFSTVDNNCYFVDTSSYVSSTIYNTNLKYVGTSNIDFKRSNVDCLSIEYDLDKLKTIFADPTLTFDGLSIDYAEDDSFDFNTVLIYYSVYNKTLDKVLATNLLGVLFLDPPSGNTSGYPIFEILMPSITKLQSGATGFGTSYSFRLNIKSDYMLDDTQAIVTDTTASQQVLEDFGQVFDSLAESLSILNQHTGTINHIVEQYLDITSNQTNIENQIYDLQYQVNDIARDITGTENALAMFSDGDDPLVDSSVYMKNGKIGFFTQNPNYPAQFDVSVKVKDLIIENAIRDTSGNILLGYGSPLQIGSTTGNRSIVFYSGSSTPIFTINPSQNIVFDSSVVFTQKVVFDSSLLDSNGNPISGGGGSGDVTKAYTDASLIIRDVRISATNSSIGIIRGSYIPSASLGTGLSWSAGKIYVDVSVAGGTVTSAYVDGSLSTRDSFIAVLNSSTVFYATNSSVNSGFWTNSSLGILNGKVNYIDPCLGISSKLAISMNSSIALYATNVSVNTALVGYANLGGATFSGAVTLPANSVAATVADANDNTTKIATTQFVQSRVSKMDVSLYALTGRHNFTETSLYTLTNRHNKTEVSVGYHDVSIKSLDSVKANKAAPVFTTSFGIGSWKFMLLGNDLLLKYGDVSICKFTTDGSILSAGNVHGLVIL